MKVLVHFKPKDKYDNFEGTRLRKCFKGALEVSDIEYVSTIDETFDVAQFISLDDEPLINQCVNNGIPTVISALYCESDPSTQFLLYKNNKKKREIVLSPRALRVLNKVNLVLVPSNKAKEFLINSGVTTDIKVVLPAINIIRFNQKREDEKIIFYRYFGENQEKKPIVCLGSSDNIDGINAFTKNAKKYPDQIFYYFFQDTGKLFWKIRQLKRQKQKNLHFVTIPSDDIYRSALLNASVLMYAGYDTLGIVSIIEAMAAKCQLIIRKQPLFEDILLDGVNCHVGEYSETISSILKDYLSGKLSPTSDNAFELAKARGLDVLGEELKLIYKDLLNKKR